MVYVQLLIATADEAKSPLFSVHAIIIILGDAVLSDELTSPDLLPILAIIVAVIIAHSVSIIFVSLSSALDAAISACRTKPRILAAVRVELIGRFALPAAGAALGIGRMCISLCHNEVSSNQPCIVR